MKAVFVDTAGWMSCADGADPEHVRSSAARDTALEAGQTLVTTDRHFRQMGFQIVPGVRSRTKRTPRRP